MKYIFPYEGGIEIRINRKDLYYSEKLSFRKHGGYKQTISHAIKKRNEVFEEAFGFPISSRFFHTTKRKSNNAGGTLPPPPGISLGYSRGRLLYVVVSWNPVPNKVKRKRWNINKLGFTMALEMATSFKSNINKEILQSDKD